MEERIRKKKQVDEFRELGFDVDAGLRPGMDRVAVHAFGDRFIAHIEAYHPVRWRDRPYGRRFVTRFGRGRATVDDLASVISSSRTIPTSPTTGSVTCETLSKSSGQQFDEDRRSA